jgi:hypothetical protein
LARFVAPPVVERRHDRSTIRTPAVAANRSPSSDVQRPLVFFLDRRTERCQSVLQERVRLRRPSRRRSSPLATLFCPANRADPRAIPGVDGRSDGLGAWRAWPNMTRICAPTAA